MDAETANRARESLLVSNDGECEVVHALVDGPFGADWNLSDAEDFIDDAISVDLMERGTIAYAMGHKLRVVSGGRTVFFETRDGVEYEPCGRCLGTKTITVDSGAAPWCTDFIMIDCPACTGQPAKEGGMEGE